MTDGADNYRYLNKKEKTAFADKAVFLFMRKKGIYLLCSSNHRSVSRAA